MATAEQFCTFYLAGNFFGVEVSNVQEVVRHHEVQITSVPLASEVIAGLINLRGQIVTSLDLRKRLGFSDRPADKAPSHVIVRLEDIAVSLLVDEIGDVIEVSEDIFEKSPETLQGIGKELIRGAYKLPDKLLIALRTDRILQLESPLKG